MTNFELLNERQKSMDGGFWSKEEMIENIIATVSCIFCPAYSYCKISTQFISESACNDHISEFLDAEHQ